MQIVLILLVIRLIIRLLILLYVEIASLIRYLLGVVIRQYALYLDLFFDLIAARDWQLIVSDQSDLRTGSKHLHAVGIRVVLFQARQGFLLLLILLIWVVIPTANHYVVVVEPRLQILHEVLLIDSIQRRVYIWLLVIIYVLGSTRVHIEFCRFDILVL